MKDMADLEAMMEDEPERVLVQIMDETGPGSDKPVLPQFSPDIPPLEVDGFPNDNIPYNNKAPDPKIISHGYEYASISRPGTLSSEQVNSLQNTAMCLFQTHMSPFCFAGDCWLLIPEGTPITKDMRALWPIRNRNGKYYAKLRIYFDIGSTTCLVTERVIHHGLTSKSNSHPYMVAGMDAKGQVAKPANVTILGYDGIYTHLPVASTELNVPDAGIYKPSDLNLLKASFNTDSQCFYRSRARADILMGLRSCDHIPTVLSRADLARHGFRFPVESPHLKMLFCRLTTTPILVGGTFGESPESLNKKAPWRLPLTRDVHILDYGIETINQWEDDVIPYKVLTRNQDSVMGRGRRTQVTPSLSFPNPPTPPPSFMKRHQMLDGPTLAGCESLEKTGSDGHCSLQYIQDQSMSTVTPYQSTEQAKEANVGEGALPVLTIKDKAGAVSYTHLTLPTNSEV